MGLDASEDSDPTWHLGTHKQQPHRTHNLNPQMDLGLTYHLGPFRGLRPTGNGFEPNKGLGFLHGFWDPWSQLGHQSEKGPHKGFGSFKGFGTQRLGANQARMFDSHKELGPHEECGPHKRFGT